MKRLKFLLGERFGRLIVTRDLGTFNAYGVFARRLECRCDCGNSHEAWASHLRAGSVRSCGCLYRDPKRFLSLPEGEAAFRTVLRSYKANAKKYERPFSLTEERFRKLILQACSYCGCSPTTVARTRAGYGEFLYNGVDRVNNDLGYVEGNVVSCCNTCNIAKQGLELPVFLDWIKRVYAHSVEKQFEQENVVKIVF